MDQAETRWPSTEAFPSPAAIQSAAHRRAAGAALKTWVTPFGSFTPEANRRRRASVLSSQTTMWWRWAILFSFASGDALEKY